MRPISSNIPRTPPTLQHGIPYSWLFVQHCTPKQATCTAPFDVHRGGASHGGYALLTVVRWHRQWQRRDGGERQMISCKWDGTPYMSPVMGLTAPSSKNGIGGGYWCMLLYPPRILVKQKAVIAPSAFCCACTISRDCIVSAAAAIVAINVHLLHRLLIQLLTTPASFVVIVIIERRQT